MGLLLGKHNRKCKPVVYHYTWARPKELTLTSSCWIITKYTENRALISKILRINFWPYSWLTPWPVCCPNCVSKIQYDFESWSCRGICERKRKGKGKQLETEGICGEIDIFDSFPSINPWFEKSQLRNQLVTFPPFEGVLIHSHQMWLTTDRGLFIVGMISTQRTSEKSWQRHWWRLTLMTRTEGHGWRVHQVHLRILWKM